MFGLGDGGEDARGVNAVAGSKAEMRDVGGVGVG